jgi:hypothetical protein
MAKREDFATEEEYQEWLDEHCRDWRDEIEYDGLY